MQLVDLILFVAHSEMTQILLQKKIRTIITCHEELVVIYRATDFDYV